MHLSDLAQAVRFMHQSFTPVDIATILVAFVKLEFHKELISDILCEQVQVRIESFSNKDLSLLLWTLGQPGWAQKKHVASLVSEVQRRDLTTFTVQDICMTAQALAKVGDSGKAGLCFMAVEAFGRQLLNFATVDKALLLWSLAKSRVHHEPLCRLLVRSLVAEGCSRMSREVVSAALWSLAIVWSSLQDDQWPRKLARTLCAATPWIGAQPYEIANAAWAFSQLPDDVVAGSWESWANAADALDVGTLNLHELCNLLRGLAAGPPEVCKKLVTRTVASILNRLSRGDKLCSHDNMTLSRALSCGNWQSMPDFNTLRTLLPPEQSDEDKHLRETDRHEATCSTRKSNFTRKPYQPSQTTFETPPGTPREGASNESPADDEGLLPPAAVSHGKCPGEHGCGRSRCAHTGSSSCSWGRASVDKNEDAETKSPSSSRRFARRASRVDRSESPEAVKQHGAKHCSQSCCPAVFGPSNDSLLRLNAHCQFSGHCVQLKHTFIHVECSSLSDDDCMLCDLSRRISRSADDIELSDRRFYSPALNPTRVPDELDPDSDMPRSQDLQAQKTSQAPGVRCWQ